MASTFIQVNFPLPVIGEVGATVSLSALLDSAFGNGAQNITGAWLHYYDASSLAAWNFSYWNTAAPTVSAWRIGGEPIAGSSNTSLNQPYVNSAQFVDVDVQIGNPIFSNLFMTVRIDQGSPDPVYMQYRLSSVGMAAPALAPAGQAPTPDDIVQTAISMAAQFPNTPNNNDCHNIATIVAAAAGAPLTNTSASLVPSQNIEHGFWRIAYRGVPNTNWESLTRPGDIVRFDWADPSAPQHTVVILGSLQSNGTIEVYDNGDYRNGVSYIGRHMANYDARSVPSSVTIYRLTTDNLYLVESTDAGESLIGTTYNDLVRAKGGDDIVRGGVGDDLLDGGGGSDTLDGGVGSDTCTYISSGLGVSVNLSLPGAQDTVGAGVDTLIDIENLTGSSFGDTLTGDTGGNVLNGGAGNDILVGGLGDDTYVVDVLADVVTELAGEGTDTVQSTVSWVLGADLENLTLTGAAALNGTGNEQANVLTGNALANTLDGKGGADTLVGGLGGDTYVVDDAGDVVTETSALATELDTVKSSVSYTLGANLENLTLTGTGNIDGSGNALKNLITGNDGANVLDGAGGADTLKGGKGNDTYHVDLVKSGAVAVLQDVVTENLNEGTDTLVLRAAGDLGLAVSTTLTLGANLEHLDISATGSNKLNLTGNAAANTLTGNAGDNVLTGGAGNDILNGGGGMDSLTGGIGSDTFVLAQHLTNMVAAIQDFTAGTDNIGLGQAAFGDLFNNGSLMDGVFAVSTSATTAAMRLYYNQTQGTLYYDSDGNGGSVAIAIANFSSKPVVSASNFMLAVGV